MNDIAKPIMNVEKCLRRVSDQIAHGNMTSTQLFITHHAILDAIANLLDAKAWVSDRLSKHTEEPNQIVQPDETRYAREEESKPDWFQKYQQLTPEIRTLLVLLNESQTQAEKILGLSPQSQTPTPPYAGAKQDSQPDVDRALQDIRERAEAEKNRTMLGRPQTLHVASRSLKID